MAKRSDESGGKEKVEKIEPKPAGKEKGTRTVIASKTKHNSQK